MTTQRFKNDQEDVTSFLAQGNTLERLKELKSALEKPDGPPVPQQPATVTHLRGDAPPSDLPKPSPNPLADRVPPQDLARGDVGIEVPAPSPNKGGRPLIGSKPKIEKTFAIDEDIHQFLIEVSNWEGIRHRKKFSVSYIMNHALMFAIAHMDGTKMIPIDGREGLVIPENRKETEQ